LSAPARWNLSIGKDSYIDGTLGPWHSLAAKERTIVMPEAALPVDSQQGAEEIRARVTRVVFPQKEEGGFAIYAVKMRGKSDFTVKITSTITAEIGDNIIARGKWGNYKGKPQFIADMLMLEISKDLKAIKAWLRSKMVKGIGEATIDKLIAAKGDDLPSVIHDASQMADAIGDKKAHIIADAWNNNELQPQIVTTLLKYDLTFNAISKIIAAYGGNTIKVVQERPWSLAAEIEGVGFPTADKIAIDMGHAKDSPHAFWRHTSTHWDKRSETATAAFLSMSWSRKHRR
jgi:exodeoxyribonuclease V alpha subunit